MVDAKAITVRVDIATKERAEKVLAEIGINMTAYITSSLKALVREKRVPFEMVTSEYSRPHYRKMILEDHLLFYTVDDVSYEVRACRI